MTGPRSTEPISHRNEDARNGSALAQSNADWQDLRAANQEADDAVRCGQTSVVCSDGAFPYLDWLETQ